IEVVSEVSRDDLRCHGFAGAGQAREQDRKPLTADSASVVTPRLVHGGAMSNPGAQLTQALDRVRRQDDVFPDEMRLEPSRRTAERWAADSPGRVEDVPH